MFPAAQRNARTACASIFQIPTAYLDMEELGQTLTMRALSFRRLPKCKRARR